MLQPWAWLLTQAGLDSVAHSKRAHLAADAEPCTEHGPAVLPVAEWGRARGFERCGRFLLARSRPAALIHIGYRAAHGAVHYAHAQCSPAWKPSQVSNATRVHAARSHAQLRPRTSTLEGPWPGRQSSPPKGVCKMPCGH